MSEDECDKIEIVNRAEELLLRPREVARSIQEKLRKTMAAHGLGPPHGPGWDGTADRVHEREDRELDAVQDGQEPR
jgi:hypothetical protein